MCVVLCYCTVYTHQIVNALSHSPDINRYGCKWQLVTAELFCGSLTVQLHQQYKHNHTTKYHSVIHSVQKMNINLKVIILTKTTKAQCVCVCVETFPSIIHSLSSPDLCFISSKLSIIVLHDKQPYSCVCLYCTFYIYILFIFQPICLLTYTLYFIVYFIF